MAIAAVVLTSMLAPSVAQAATWTVTSTTDGAGAECPSATKCTLREAVEDAADGDTIELGAGTYKLENEHELTIEKVVTIVGAGASATTLTTTKENRLIYLDDGELTITGVTLRGGVATASSDSDGGAIYNAFGVLRVSNCVFTDDTARQRSNGTYGDGGEGGAIDNDGRTLITSTSFSSNLAEGGSAGTTYDEGGEGGAIYSAGFLALASSTFTANTAAGGSDTAASDDNDGGGGGAVYVEEGALSVAGSTFAANVAGGGATAESGKREGYEGEGGAIYNDGAATITASTLDGANTAKAGANGSMYSGDGGEGGAIYNEDALTVNGSTISGNVAASTVKGGDGGGIDTYGSTVISGSTISGNKAPNGSGGGVYEDGGALTVRQSTVSGNETPDGEGGGLYAEGVALIEQSTITGNAAADGDGGGIDNDAASMEVVASTVGPANSAKNGGGLFSEGVLGLTNATIAGNTASEYGGGIYNDDPGTLASATIADNAAQKPDGGGNLYLEYSSLTLHDTLIASGASPTSGGNCAFHGSEGVIVSHGYNAEDSNQCELAQPSDHLNAPLALGPLQGNGGPTATIALLAGSAAIGAGDPAGCTGVEGEALTVDQRGVTRPQAGGRCSIGAFEYVPPTVAPTPVLTPVAPQISALALAPSSFVPESRGASIAKSNKHRAKKPTTGTTVSYTDSEAATTTFTIVTFQKGYRVGHGSCKAPPSGKHAKRPPHAKTCQREVRLGSFTHVDTAGHNSFKFSGRVSGRALAKGSYELTATPKVGSLSGHSHSVNFKIV